MNKSDTVVRYVAFSFSLALYFTLLPIVLSYSFGYHIDFAKLKIYKTGIISLTSNPSGASIYINGKLYPDITPARVEELKPGSYSVEVKRDGFYPWQKDLSVVPNMVTRADNIILFPALRDMAKISPVNTVDFAIPESRSQIYHMTKTGLYRSNIDGTGLKKLSPYSSWPDRITDKKFSPDGKRILYFNKDGIWVIYLNAREQVLKMPYPAVIEQVYQAPGLIKDAFWHSGSNHVVFISDKDIDVLELGMGQDNGIVTLHKCSSAPRGVYYDVYSDSLYFNDSKNGYKENVYRLDLREKFFDKFMQRVKKELDIIYEKR